MKLYTCQKCGEEYSTGDAANVDPQDPLQSDANARLIAAAPNLLAACKAASEGTYVDIADADDLTEVDQECWGMLNAAIAKAEGSKS